MEQEDDQVCSSWGNVHVVSPRAAPIVVQEAGQVRTPDETVSLPETLSEEPEDSPIAIVSVQELGGSEWAIELDLRLNAAQASLHVAALVGVRLVREFGLAFPEKHRSWLDEESSLISQGVCTGSVLIYKKKYFIADEELTPEDAIDTHAITLATLQAVVLATTTKDGNLSVIEDDERSTPSVAALAELLPTGMRNGATVKCVMDGLENSQTLSRTEARFQLVHICSLLSGYGVSAYVVGDAAVRRSGAISSIEKTPVLLGIGREGISRIHYKTKEVLEHYSLAQLEWFAVGRQTFVMSFGPHRLAGHLGVSTRSGHLIAQLVQGYRTLLALRNAQIQ